MGSLWRRGRRARAWACALGVGLSACAREAPPPAPAPLPAESKPRERSAEGRARAAREADSDGGDDDGDEAEAPSERKEAPARAADPRPNAKPWPADARKKAPPANPAEIARAKKLLEKGLLAYRKGDYDRAEDYLKQAMTIYPFLAEANLALGKIFLIRGSATLDRSLINNARLMFEMAHTLDPNLHETDLLLELFRGEDPP